MNLSAYCLRRARPENVERLARSLGVVLPEPTKNAAVYEQRLVHAVMSEIRMQAEADAFEKHLCFHQA